MTHSGGKPHYVGDRGQRYEVSYRDPDTGARKVFGWSDTKRGAEAMVMSITLHPSMADGEILDRRPIGEVGDDWGIAIIFLALAAAPFLLNWGFG